MPTGIGQPGQPVRPAPLATPAVLWPRQRSFGHASGPLATPAVLWPRQRSFGHAGVPLATPALLWPRQRSEKRTNWGTGRRSGGQRDAGVAKVRRVDAGRSGERAADALRFGVVERVPERPN